MNLPVLIEPLARPTNCCQQMARSRQRRELLGELNLTLAGIST